MQELVKQFGLDWKLLLAQVVNFFILLFILKKFAYGPIMQVLRDRRNKISEGIKASAQSQETLLRAEKEEKKIRNKAERDALRVVEKAEFTADVEAKKIVDSAYKKSEQVIIQGRKRLDLEHEKLAQEVETSAQDLVEKALEKVIGKMPEEKDKVLIASALRELASTTKI